MSTSWHGVKAHRHNKGKGVEGRTIIIQNKVQRQQGRGHWAWGMAQARQGAELSVQANNWHTRQAQAGRRGKGNGARAKAECTVYTQVQV